MSAFRVRPAAVSDGGFLAEMVVEAANWHVEGIRPKHEVIASPEYRRYLAGWMRPGDAGFLAVDEFAEPIGAAWYRTLPRSDPGFGYVGTGIPELIIGVRPIWRARGVGRALIREVSDHARGAGYRLISLSVQRGNHAAALYRAEGFSVTESGQVRDIMVKRLG